jgi:microcystin-dependent protein
MFAGNFAPRGYAFCNGQLLAIGQNQALFSLIGTTYGGDGRTSFALPDLRGRVPMHPGTGPGLSTHQLGDEGGQETINLVQTKVRESKKAVKMVHTGPAAIVDNQSPYLCVNYIIALQGIFPSRN